jgi:hypothetical protein
MTCPKLAKARMCGDGPSVCEARPPRWLWRGRTPMKVRQIEVGNDSATAGPAQVARHFPAAHKLRPPYPPAQGGAHD